MPEQPDMLGVGLPEQIAEIERELATRERVYPRLVDAGRISDAAAQRQMRRMSAVLATLRRLAAP